MDNIDRPVTLVVVFFLGENRSSVFFAFFYQSKESSLFLRIQLFNLRRGTRSEEAQSSVVKRRSGNSTVDWTRLGESAAYVAWLKLYLKTRAISLTGRRFWASSTSSMSSLNHRLSGQRRSAISINNKPTKKMEKSALSVVFWFILIISLVI